MINLSRRELLRGAGAATGLSLLPRFGIGSSMAAQTSGYKAIVCLFFHGGMDGHDFLLPYDQSSYSAFTDARGPLMNAYGSNDVGARRTRNELLELEPQNSASFGSRAFALPPEMPELQSLFNQGHASIVGNVGPLVEALSRTNWEDRTGARPKSLFSHNDMASTWLALAPEGARFGWGGEFADRMIAANANLEPNFTAISVSGQSVFLSGETAQGFQITDQGSATISELDGARILGPGRESSVAQGLLAEHFSGQGMTRTNLYERDIVRVAERSVEVNARFNEAIEQGFDLQTTFPNTRLGGQLASVARTINARFSVGAHRQVFFASMGGFDTHSSQAQNLPGHQREISEAVGAFYAAMTEMGVQNEVTLFSASDFGRTLTANGDGTDHGWGSHSFVVGGGINGGQIFGDVPPPTFDHDWDAGRGRLIPSTSIEQFAAPLGRWFGLNEGELSAIFPRLPNFGQGPALA